MVSYCASMRDLIIPDSVTTIEDEAFVLAKIAFFTIPASVEYIGGNAFSVMSNLKYVRLMGITPPTIEENTFENPPSASFEGFLVPSGCGETYKTAEGWSAFADYIIEEEASA